MEKPCSWLADFVDGELNEEQTNSLEEHVAECVKCQHELNLIADDGQRFLEQTIEEENASVALPMEIQQRVITQVSLATASKQFRTSGPARSNTASLAALLGVAAAILILVGLLDYARRGGQSNSIEMQASQQLSKLDQDVARGDKESAEDAMSNTGRSTTEFPEGASLRTRSSASVIASDGYLVAKQPTTPDEIPFFLVVPTQDP